jgi:dTDP-4-dehydrorhamnose 3,5-epimerase
MLFENLEIPGAAVVRIERKTDPRGFFARTFCAGEFSSHGLPHEMVQASISYNEHRGTIRGLHFQRPPSREGKLVRCIRGRLFDVLLDLRPDSPTYLQHRSVMLDDDSRAAVFIPHGVAHGFQTLSERAEVLYLMSDFYAPDLGAGVRWNDPAFAIEWPLEAAIISERDAGYPSFDRSAFETEMKSLVRPGGSRP